MNEEVNRNKSGRMNGQSRDRSQGTWYTRYVIVLLRKGKNKVNRQHAWMWLQPRMLVEEHSHKMKQRLRRCLHPRLSPSASVAAGLVVVVVVVVVVSAAEIGAVLLCSASPGSACEVSPSEPMSLLSPVLQQCGDG